MARGRRGSGARGNRGRKSSSRKSKSTSSRSSRSKNTRGSGARGNRGRTTSTKSRSTTKKKSTPTSRRTSPSNRNNRRGVGTNKAAAAGVKNTVKKAVSAVKNTVGRITRPQAAVASNRRNTVTTTRNQTFNNQLKKIQAVNTPSIDASNYRSLSIDQQRAVQQGKYGETFGLNPITQRNEINRIQNMIKAQNAARLRQGLDPTFSGQSLKQAKDADGDGYADNMGNRIASVYNATFGRLGLPNMPKQTVAGANISMNRPMGQRLPGLVRKRGSSGGASRIQQQAAAAQMQPETAPTIGQPVEETGAAPMDNSELTRIQNQAYNTQLTSSLAGMFGGQGSVGYTPQGSTELSPTLKAGQSRGRRRVRMFGARRRRGGTGDQFSRAGDRIAKLTNINI